MTAGAKKAKVLTGASPWHSSPRSLQTWGIHLSGCQKPTELCGRGLGSCASRWPWLYAIWLLPVLGLRGKLSVPSCLRWPSILIAWQVGQGTEAKQERVEESKDELGCFPVSPHPLISKKGALDARNLLTSKSWKSLLLYPVSSPAQYTVSSYLDPWLKARGSCYPLLHQPTEGVFSFLLGPEAEESLIPSSSSRSHYLRPGHIPSARTQCTLLELFCPLTALIVVLRPFAGVPGTGTWWRAALLAPCSCVFCLSWLLVCRLGGNTTTSPVGGPSLLQPLLVMFVLL